jgi:hypothetical protein
MSCQPSGRRATIASDRFSFAYAGTIHVEGRDTVADILLASCVPGSYLPGGRAPVIE